MSKSEQHYTVLGVDLFGIRNRNETRVAKHLREAIELLEDTSELSDETVMDAFAYALNLLPSRYAQIGTIVLREPVKNEVIVQAVDEALRKVLHSPKTSATGTPLVLPPKKPAKKVAILIPADEEVKKKPAKKRLPSKNSAGASAKASGASSSKAKKTSNKQ